MSASVAVHGKCILLGEHSVVRGQPALVFPLLSKQLTLSWNSQPGDAVEINGGDYSEAFRSALDLALAKTGNALARKKWNFAIKSEIPVRAGLGSSAALAVATVRFLESLGLQKGDPFPLALEIENIFHGRSSGIDVAATLSAVPILFQRNQAPQPLLQNWNPQLYLFDSGLRSSTKACVEQVVALHRPDLDKQMGYLVQAASDSLQQANGFETLATAMNASVEIFREWQLVPASVEAQMKELISAGASAVKPTGSGNGGYLLSLWRERPPSSLPLIPLSGDSS